MQRPQYICSVDRSTKYFVARQQYKRSPLLNFCGNTNTFVLFTATCTSTIQRARIVVFPWQQWLRERAPVLPYTYTSRRFF